MSKDTHPKVVVIPDGKICDYIDGTFRDDTPEEYVRQTIEKRLINEHKYTTSQIEIEYTIQLASSKKRADIVLFDSKSAHTQANIHIIIECKNENIEITSAKDGVEQLKSYMSACPNCNWGMWTNGKQKEVYRKVVNQQGQIVFEDYIDIPSADGNIDDIDRPKRNTLKNASDDNLLFVFKTCHNHIYINDGLQKQPAFFELLKVIFCKIQDERNIPAPLEFYATSSQRNNSDGQLTVKKRIAQIFENVKSKHGKIFEPNDEIMLSARSLSYIVSELQKYSLLNTHIDIKGKAYEEIVGANLRGDRGEFFTPRNIMKMVVEMINPALNERVLDSSCGTGGFLVNAMTHVMNNMRIQYTIEMGMGIKDWDVNSKSAFFDRVIELAQSNYFGFDINPDLVKATKINMLMNKYNNSNIFQVNTLTSPCQWTDYLKRKLSESFRIPIESLCTYSAISLFDVIVTNPPFGKEASIKDKKILEQYELAHIWKYKEIKGKWTMTPRLQSSVPPEILFIERCIQFLVPGGRLGIVLPDSILGDPSLGYIRDWLIVNTRIIASIDLSEDTFQPLSGTKTSVLILQKKTHQEIVQEQKNNVIADYNIFMAIVEKIGHDKRGKPTFKRDEEGNEILTTEIDSVTGKESNVKQLDDETPDIPPEFALWKIKEGIKW